MSKEDFINKVYGLSPLPMDGICGFDKIASKLGLEANEFLGIAKVAAPLWREGSHGELYLTIDKLYEIKTLKNRLRAQYPNFSSDLLDKPFRDLDLEFLTEEGLFLDGYLREFLYNMDNSFGLNSRTVSDGILYVLESAINRENHETYLANDTTSVTKVLKYIYPEASAEIDAMNMEESELEERFQELNNCDYNGEASNTFDQVDLLDGKDSDMSFNSGRDDDDDDW